MAGYGQGTVAGPVTFGGPGKQSAAPPAGGKAEKRQSAKALIARHLERFGLSGLAEWAWRKMLDGEKWPQILLEMRETKAYKTRFAGLEALREKGRAVSEADYIGRERSLVEVFRVFGIPKGFYDEPAELGRLIGGEVSARELGDRLEIAAQAADVWFDPEKAAAIRRDFGIASKGDLIALLLDPKKASTVLQRRWRQAQIGGAAEATGFGSSQAEDRRLAADGVTAEQAAAGFSALAGAHDLFTPLVGTTEGEIGRDTGIAAVFEDNATAKRTIERRRAARQAQFEGSSQFASSKGGFTGIGEGT